MFLRKSVTDDPLTSNISWLYSSDIVVTQLPNGAELAVSYNPENWKAPVKRKKNNERRNGKN